MNSEATSTHIYLDDWPDDLIRAVACKYPYLIRQEPCAYRTESELEYAWESVFVIALDDGDRPFFDAARYAALLRSFTHEITVDSGVWRVADPTLMHDGTDDNALYERGRGAIKRLGEQAQEPIPAAVFAAFAAAHPAVLRDGMYSHIWCVHERDMEAVILGFYLEGAADDQLLDFIDLQRYEQWAIEHEFASVSVDGENWHFYTASEQLPYRDSDLDLIGIALDLELGISRWPDDLIAAVARQYPVAFEIMHDDLFAIHYTDVSHWARRSEQDPQDILTSYIRVGDWLIPPAP